MFLWGTNQYLLRNGKSGYENGGLNIKEPRVAMRFGITQMTHCLDQLFSGEPRKKYPAVIYTPIFKRWGLTTKHSKKKYKSCSKTNYLISKNYYCDKESRATNKRLAVMPGDE